MFTGDLFHPVILIVFFSSATTGRTGPLLALTDLHSYVTPPWKGFFTVFVIMLYGPDTGI